jgi:hypothetical protein
MVRPLCASVSSNRAVFASLSVWAAAGAHGAGSVTTTSWRAILSHAICGYWLLNARGSQTCRLTPASTPTLAYSAPLTRCGRVMRHVSAQVIGVVG